MNNPIIDAFISMGYSKTEATRLLKELKAEIEECTSYGDFEDILYSYDLELDYAIYVL